MTDNETRAHFVGKRIKTDGATATILRMQRDMRMNWIIEYVRDSDGGTGHFLVQYPEYEIEIIPFSQRGGTK